MVRTLAAALLAGGAILLSAACGGAAAGGSASTSGSAGSQGAAGGKLITARLAHNLPAQQHVGLGMQHFADLVNERGAGKIRIDVYSAGQLFSDLDMPNAISSGAVEMGMTTTSTWGGLSPINDLWSIPFLFEDNDHVYRSLDSGLNDLMQEERAKLNDKVLIWVQYSGVGSGGYASNVPLTSPEAWQGKRVRCIGALGCKLVELAGGSPVNLGGAEVEEALQRGTIDASVSGFTSFVSRHYYEFTKYVMPTNVLGYGMFDLSVNLDWYNSLPDDVRQIIDQAAAESQQWIRDLEVQETQKALQELQDKGMQLVQQPESEQERFKKIRDQLIQEDFLPHTGDLGQRALDVVEKERQS